MAHALYAHLVRRKASVGSDSGRGKPSSRQSDLSGGAYRFTVLAKSASTLSPAVLAIASAANIAARRRSTLCPFGDCTGPPSAMVLRAWPGFKQDAPARKATCRDGFARGCNLAPHPPVHHRRSTTGTFTHDAHR